MAASEVLPIFFLYTSTDVIAIPSAIVGEPNAYKVTVFDIPSMQEIARTVVVTLMISGISLDSRVARTGDVLHYSSALYSEFPSSTPRGLIYMCSDDSAGGQGRVNIITLLNTPDYDVITYQGSTVPHDSVTPKTVFLNDNAILRVPVREVIRQFASTAAISDTLIAPGIATFTRFRSSSSSPPTSTFIVLPDYARSTLGLVSSSSEESANSNGQLSVNNSTFSRQKMSTLSWTVIGILWATVIITFLISIGMSYSWYIRQYM